jgi:hypothetical protein
VCVCAAKEEAAVARLSSSAVAHNNNNNSQQRPHTTSSRSDRHFDSAVGRRPNRTASIDRRTSRAPSKRRQVPLLLLRVRAVKCVCGERCSAARCWGRVSAYYSCCSEEASERRINLGMTNSKYHTKGLIRLRFRFDRIGCEHSELLSAESINQSINQSHSHVLADDEGSTQS